MKHLLRLYPRGWRRRYGPEMEALLEATPFGWREAGDLVRGALDAHLHPQWRPHRGRPWVWVAFVILLSPLVSRAVSVTLGAGHLGPPRPPYRDAYLLPSPHWLVPGLALTALWAAAALPGRLVGGRLLVRFCSLLALRFAADSVLPLVKLALAVDLFARTGHGSVLPSLQVAFDLAQVAAGGAFALVVLRRTRIGWPAALAIGCLLELAVGNTNLSLAALVERPLLSPRPGGVVSDWLFLPGYLEPLRVTLWAGTLALLSGVRRPRPGWGGEPSGGAGVPARPTPDRPPALAASVDRERAS
jgi:hypothetical protein